MVSDRSVAAALQMFGDAQSNFCELEWLMSFVWLSVSEHYIDNSYSINKTDDVSVASYVNRIYLVYDSRIEDIGLLILLSIHNVNRSRSPDG